MLPIQSDLSRLEKGADRYPMQFKKGKCKVLYLVRSNPLNQYMLGTTQIERSLAKNNLEILEDAKLDRSQQRALTARVSSNILV